MPTKLNDIELSDDLEWPDEMNWSPVAQQIDVSLGGSLIIEEAAQLRGRPITLQSGGSGNTWWGVVTRETVEALRELAAMPLSSPMLLELADGREFDVRWRHDAGAIEARPIVYSPVMPMEDTDLYAITLRLIEV